MALSNVLLKGKAKVVVDEDLDSIFKSSAGPSTTSDTNKEKPSSSRPHKRKSVDGDPRASSGQQIRKKGRTNEHNDSSSSITQNVTSPSQDVDVSESNDSDDDEGSKTTLPKHESLTKERKSKRAKTSNIPKRKYIPEGETKVQRDDRSIFIGNVPAEVIKSKPMLKKLKNHILSFVPNAAIESVRLRSIAFKIPTAPLEEESEKKKANRNQSRAAKWREGQDPEKDGEKADQKVFLTPKEKRKVAFIKGEVHDKASSIHAYVVFAYPIPEELLPKNVAHKEVIDPFIAARTAVERCDGTSFLEHTLRVDYTNKPTTASTETSSQTGALTDPRLSVFVGNLDFASSEEDLRAFFEALVCAERGAPEESDGEADDRRHKTWVTRVRVVRDRDTLVGKGFAYVQFAERDCVDEVLAMEQEKLKFAKRKLRVQRCKIIPSTGDKRDRVAQPSNSSKAPKLHASTRASISIPRSVPQLHGDPKLGEKLVGLPKEQRKQIKSTDADRVARRLAKKKARAALEKDGVKAKAKDRMRERKSIGASGKTLNKGRKEGRPRMRSDKAMAKKNFKKQ